MTETLVRDEVTVLGRTFEYKWLVATIYVGAVFLDILDITIVNVALPQLGKQLNSDAVEWVVVGYTLALAASIPLAGWWSDKVGTKTAFLVSLALFTLGSLACGFANSMGMLIAFRVFQGVGGGMLTPVGLSMLYRAFPPAERIRVAVVITVPTLLAPALGPILGGLLVTHVGWRWIFWVNFPICTVVFIAAVAVLREHRESSAGRFDLPGFILSGGGLALSLYALSEGPRSGWTATPTLLAGTIGVLMLIAFVYTELRVEHPMLDLRLLKNRGFRSANIVMNVSMASFFGLLFVLPLYLQNYRGISAQASGLITFPQALGVMITSQIAGRIYRRVGPRKLITVGFGAAAVVILAFVTIGPNTSFWEIRGLMFARGLSMGLAFTPIQAVAYSSISPSDMGRASSIFSTLRQVSISVGVAVMSTLLAAFTNLVGKPVDPERALHGYRVSILVSTVLLVIATSCAWWMVKDEDAAATLGK